MIGSFLDLQENYVQLKQEIGQDGDGDDFGRTGSCIIDGNDDEEETEKEFMFKMHQGLVKIQALIRGFLAKIKVNKKREE